MSRESLVFLFGLASFLTPFLGIPDDYKRAVFIVSGILLMIIGYSLRRSAFLRSLESGNGERKNEAFVESIHNDTTKESRD
jgi:uncharacterized membrane protein